ncbi:GNAT family N-acetyltransferase [Patescibacteria group bacterium]|nr:GNAT family N-acetyltransferase [Patescibacteria group bacterium]
MESHFERERAFTIKVPQEGDEISLAPMHIQAWKETYIVPESGLTGESIDTMLAHLLADTTYRKNVINESLTSPNVVLYRVVKNGAGEIVGFLHGTKNESYNELEAIYLLNEAKGSGVGGKLMEEFLNWADGDTPCRLEAFAFNDPAIGFYVRYGFKKTDTKLPPYKGLSVIEMVRPVDGG